MVRSMTGYGRGEANENSMSVTVELKSVNHRFFECTVKSPRQFAFLEDKLKSYVQSRVQRGKIDVFVSCDFGSNDCDEITVNEAYAEEYINALKKLAKRFKLKNDITVSKVAENENVFKTVRRSFDEELAEKLLLSSTEDAVDMFISAREAEGARLTADVLSKADGILQKVAFVEEHSPETVKAYRERLYAKMKEVLADTSVDEQRIVTETAIFADKVAVDEETVRLRSHIAHLKDLFNAGGTIGKQLDFTVQEMNRETNTIGSKCQDIEISRTVVDMKSEIEKIREQIQNIE